MKVATVIEVRKPVAVIQMACTVCGACADASCDCGAPYLPAGQRAAAAVAANPEKSDRAIAAEIGVGRDTVGRARGSAAPGGAHATPERRIGRDGKSYPSTKASRSDEEMPTEEEAEESYQETLHHQACMILESMSDETRQRFFADVRMKYHVEITCSE